MGNPLKARVQAGQPTRGLWLELGSPALAEAAVWAGFRFVLVDNEHGPAGHETAAHMLRAVEAAGGHAMTRVPINDVAVLKRTLEIGYSSIMVPMINTAEQARAAVDACRYPPRGARGLAGEIRAARYGLDAGYAARAHEDLFLMLQIESAEGVANAAAIAAVEGVDMIFIGPWDLSGSLGVLGQTGHPEVRAAIAQVEAAAKMAGKPVGSVPREGMDYAALFAAGYPLVIGGSDAGLATTAMRAEAAASEAGWLG